MYIELPVYVCRGCNYVDVDNLEVCEYKHILEDSGKILTFKESKGCKFCGSYKVVKQVRDFELSCNNQEREING